MTASEAAIRRAYVRPRTFDHVCELMAAALGLFMPDECAHYVRHCGYRFTT